MSWFTGEQAAFADVAEVIAVLSASPDSGLTTREADNRRQVHGLNEVVLKTPEPLWKKYLDQFNNPFILLLLASAIISVFMRQFDDAISIAVAIVIVVTVGFVQEYRSEKTLERMEALLPPACHALRDGKVETLFAKYLVPGDVVQLSTGDKVPADLRLIQVNELALDESSFTGETDPKYKSVDAVTRRLSLDVSEMNNICFQGTLVINGTGLGVVVCTGEQSQFGEVFKMMQAEEPPRSPLQISMDTLGKQLSAYSIGVIIIIMVIGWLQGRPILDMFNVGVSLAVAAIPEGLPIVVTVTLAFGVMRMAGRQAVVKRLPTVEALGCVDYICSDKTGTLTSNEMTVTTILGPSDIFSPSLSGSLDTADDGFNSLTQTRPSLPKNEETNAVMEAAMVCNNATLASGSPTEKALLIAGKGLNLEGCLQNYNRLKEVPFSSERKFMAVQCRSTNSQDEVYFVKGAPEVVLAMSKDIALNNGEGGISALNEVQRKRILEVSDLLGSRGKRVLALAVGNGSMERLRFLGYVGLTDPPRPGVRESIQVLKRSKVKVSKVTGDSKETALAISKMLALTSDNGDQDSMLSGSDIDRISDRELCEIAPKCFCFYRTTPRHKVRIVKALQARGHIVGMTGDGVNDGVAVKKADVGISMGVTGTDVCKEAADMILLNDDFSTILNAIEEGKCIFYNIQNFVRFQLSTSIAALMLISLSTLLDIPNPLNPMQILWINVIMDGPPAQSLGLEPVDREVLKKPPRKKTDAILSRSLLINVLISAGVIIAGTLWVFYEMMEDGKMTARDTTMTFTCFVFFDMFNALSSRSQNRLIFEVGFFSNKMFCVAVVLSVLGQLAVIYFPPLQYVFQTEALALTDLFLLVALSSSVFILCETKKFFERYHWKGLNGKISRNKYAKEEDDSSGASAKRESVFSV